MSKDYNPLTAHLDLSTQLKQSQNINSINKLSMFHWPGDYQNQSQGQRQVKQDLSCYQWQSAIIDGASNIPKLMAGMRFQVASSSVKGQFYAIEVQHHGYDYSQLPEQASQALGQNQDGELEPIQSYDNKFQAVSALSTFAPLKIAKPQIRGYIPALIVGLKDQSLYTDNLGRVKVEFPWDLRDLHSSKSSCWLRLSQMATGTNFNSHFTPRVGDEVSVIFVDGNIDKPLCLGCNYHGDKQSPYLLPELQPKSGIKTRLIKDGQTVQDKNKGHELCFDDTVNSEALTLTAQNALNAMVKHDDEVTIYKQRQQHIKGKNLLNVGEQHQLISAKALSLSAGQGQIQLLPKSILFKASNTSMG